MDATAWAAKLIVTAALLGGFGTPGAPPQVSLQDGSFLAARLCDGGCRVRGAYVPLEGVLLDSHLDLDGSPQDRSVLVHELVHYLQDLQGRFNNDGPCDRWKEREIEAYGVQENYLSRYNLGLGNRPDMATQAMPANCTLASDTPERPRKPATAHLFSEPGR